jgi:hypothetical protein
MTVIMRADCVCLAIARVPASAETVAGAAAHHRGGPFAWAEVLGNFTGGAECGDFCFGGEMHACRLGGGQTRLQLQSMARMVPASRRSRRGLRSGDLWLTTLPMISQQQMRVMILTRQSTRARFAAPMDSSTRYWNG